MVHAWAMSRPPSDSESFVVPSQQMRAVAPPMSTGDAAAQYDADQVDGAVTAIRVARLDERLDVIELQRRASLANPGDRAALLAHPEAVDTPAEQFAAGQVTVAEIEGTVLGFAAMIPREDGDIELDALFTEPSWWRQGIARALVRHGAEQARLGGAKALYVIGNPHAEQFYLAEGFVPTGAANTEFGPATAYVLRLIQ